MPPDRSPGSDRACPALGCGDLRRSYCRDFVTRLRPAMVIPTAVGAPAGPAWRPPHRGAVAHCCGSGRSPRPGSDVVRTPAALPVPGHLGPIRGGRQRTNRTQTTPCSRPRGGHNSPPRSPLRTRGPYGAGPSPQGHRGQGGARVRTTPRRSGVRRQHPSSWRPESPTGTQPGPRYLQRIGHRIRRSGCGRAAGAIRTVEGHHTRELPGA